MKATFIEMSSFSKYRSLYLSDDDFRSLQETLLAKPNKGDCIAGTGGLRKIRWSDAKRGKGKRGGTRIIYYFHQQGSLFWLFMIYGKNEMSDLTKIQKKVFKKALETEIKARRRP